MIFHDTLYNFGSAPASPEADDQAVQLLGFDPNLIWNHQLPADPLGTCWALVVALAVAAVFSGILCVVYYAKIMMSATSVKKGLNSLYLAVFLESLASFTLIPALGAFIVTIGCTALQIAGLAFGYSFFQFIGSGIIGRLADRMDRKVVVMWTLIVSAASHVTVGLTLYLPRRFHLETLTSEPYKINGRAELGGDGINCAYWFLCLSRVISGFFACTVSVVQAMVAEISHEEVRTANIATVMAAFALGMISGPALAAFLYDWGILTLCYSASAVAIINAIYTYLTLDLSEWNEGVQWEPYPLEEQTHMVLIFAPNSVFQESVDVFFAHPSILLLLLATFLTAGAQAMSLQGAGLIQLQVYHYGGALSSSMVIFSGICMVIAQVKLTGVVVSWLGEAGAIMLGSIMRFCTIRFYVTFMNPIMPWFSAFASALDAAMVDAPLQGLMATYAPEHAMATMFGWQQSVRCLSDAIFPVLAGWLSDQQLTWPLDVASGLAISGGLTLAFFLGKQGA